MKERSSRKIVCGYYIYSFSLFVFFVSSIIAELLSSWESLLHWSENESVAKKLQDDMAALVNKLNKICTSEPILDNDTTIQLAIEETQVSDTDLN